MKTLTLPITRVVRETHDVVTLYMPRVFDFTPGQYVTVHFDQLGKAYSLSSTPQMEDISITVKDIGGIYSSRLCQMKVGDMLSISTPYGHFNPQTNKPLVGIAAGVGISPIWSVFDAGQLENTKLYYSNRTASDIVFHSQLKKCRSDVTHHLTREPADGAVQGRIDPVAIVREIASDAHYLICGSVDFVSSMCRGLSGAGVPMKSISTETFFEQ